MKSLCERSVFLKDARPENQSTVSRKFVEPLHNLDATFRICGMTGN